MEDFNEKIPKQVHLLLKTLNVNGFEAFLVGGCVRDAVMGKTPKDWDITTSALPSDVKSLFKKTFDTGIKHGTVTVLIDHIPYEVTTYRLDGKYSDGRRPDSVSFTSDLNADLIRRDFTMNAMAYHPEKGLIDPFFGKNDIAMKKIRGVGDARVRFQEDALRMVRAVRFSCSLGFEIEEETIDALFLESPLIKNVSIERIREEFVKMILCEDVSAMRLLIDSKILEHIHKVLSDFLCINFENLSTYLNMCDKTLHLRLSLLIFKLYTPHIEAIMSFFKFDNKTQKDVIVLSKCLNQSIFPDHYHVRKSISMSSRKNISDLINLKKILESGNLEIERIERIFFECLNDCVSLKELKINGEVIKSLGIVDGKKIGEMLQKLLDAVLRNPELNDEAALLKLAHMESISQVDFA